MTAQLYEIIAVGRLEERWQDWFGGLQIKNLPNDQVALRGEVPDQAALYGILERIRDLNLELILVRKIR